MRFCSRQISHILAKALCRLSSITWWTHANSIECVGVCWQNAKRIPVILRHQNWHQKLPGNYTQSNPSDKWYVMYQGKWKNISDTCGYQICLWARYVSVSYVKNRALKPQQKSQVTFCGFGCLSPQRWSISVSPPPPPKLPEKLLW